MEFTVSIVANLEYYNEAYDELIKTMKYKKYEMIVGIILTIFGIFLLFKDKSNILGIFPILFVIAGIFEILNSLYSKKKWLKDRINSKIYNKTLMVTFNKKHILTEGPFSSGIIKCNGLQNILQTKKGILLKPENGISIYLPNYAFDSEEKIDFILNMK